MGPRRVKTSERPLGLSSDGVAGLEGPLLLSELSEVPEAARRAAKPWPLP